MNTPQIFTHPIFGELPLLIVDGVELFGAAEAASVLSYGNPRDAIRNHVDEDDVVKTDIIDSLSRKQTKNFINESGLYSLIFGAAKQGKNKEIREKAKAFKKWVTSEVLPSIRKTGSFQVAQPNNTKLLLETALEHERSLGVIDERLDRLEDETIINSSQRHKVRGMVQSAVITRLGGKKSFAYKDKSIRQSSFSSCYRQLQESFDVSSYMDIPKVRFPDAMRLIPKWAPTLELQARIDEANGSGELFR